MSRQLSFRIDEPMDSGDADRISYEPIHVGRSTFLNGQASKVHRWFRLTPSFGPELVHEMIGKMDVSRGETILDPFAGAGTTLIEAKLNGFNCVGFEINPLLHFVNQTSVQWDIEPFALRRDLDQICARFCASERVRLTELEKHGLTLPPIHNPTRWWREDVLVDLLLLKRAINAVSNELHRDFFRLSLAGCLVPDLTNVTLGKLQLHFIDRSDDEIHVLQTYENHARGMIDDLEKIRSQPRPGHSTCYLQNATDLKKLRLAAPIDAVITSPPYPNRYSYVWNTRPQLYLLDYFSTPREASDLDKRTIGGTWGTATSELAKGVVAPLNDAVGKIVRPVSDEIRKTDNLMANYVVHYFNRLTMQIMEMNRLLSPRARIAYVVGNSWIKGTYIETDVMLAEILKRLDLNFKIDDVHRFRKRHSGSKLFESIVYASKRFR